MDDNNEKFIIGDNTDGYRRSNVEYDLDLFSDPKRREKTGSDGRTSAASSTPARNKDAKKQGFFGKKNSKPVPKKEGPSVTRYAKPPREVGTGKSSRTVRKPAQGHINKAEKAISQRPSQRPLQRPLQRPVRKPAQRPMQRPGTKPLQKSANEQRRDYAQKRRVQRQRRLFIQCVAIGLCVTVAMVVLSLTVFFRIDEIKIECAGELPYSEQEIIAASGISLNENILTCDADGVGDKLSKALPYIGDATVKRSLNGRVLITVELTPGCYSFSLGENIVVVDPDGKVLEHKTVQSEDVYTEIVGADLSQATPGEKVELVDQGMFTLLDDIYTKLENAGVSGVTSIDVTDVYDVTIIYDGRITMELGDTNNIDKKLALAAMVIQRENQIDPEQYGVIDLGSVEGKAFFRPVEAPEKPTEEEVSEETSVADDVIPEVQTTASAQQ